MIYLNIKQQIIQVIKQKLVYYILKQVFLNLNTLRYVYNLSDKRRLEVCCDGY